MRLTNYTKHLLSKHLMTIGQASRITGNQPTYTLKLDVESLQMFPHRLTEQEERLLVASVIIIRHRRITRANSNHNLHSMRY